MMADWSIPKHLASFTFTTNPDSSLTLDLRPHASDSASSSTSFTPFFTTTFRPTPYLPPFPVTLTSLAPFTQTRIVLPPLPASPNYPGGEEDLTCGTDMWCTFTPKVTSWKTRVGWFDMRQTEATPGADVDADDGGVGDGDDNKEDKREENFWPGWGRWRFGMSMTDAEVVFEAPQTWKHAQAREVKS